MTVSRREWLRTVLQGIGIGMVVGPVGTAIATAQGSEAGHGTGPLTVRVTRPFDAENVDRRALLQQAADDGLVELVGRGDLDLMQPCIVEQGAGFAREKCQIAAVEADRAQALATGRHLVPDGDRIGHAAVERVVGVHQQRRAIRMGLHVFAKGGQFVLMQLG